MRAFLDGNLFEGRDDLNRDNFAAIDVARWANGNYLTVSLDRVRVDQEFDVGPARPHTDPARSVCEQVLRHAGASHRRDAADRRLITGVRDRSHRMIDSQRDVGGWPPLTRAAPPIDTDRDGMPDDWERQADLDSHQPADRNDDRDADGSTVFRLRHSCRVFANSNSMSRTQCPA